MEELAEQHLGSATELDGLLSATFHRSQDGMKVFNYGQWENAEAIENLKSNLALAQPYWDGVTINEHHYLYELVTIVRSEDSNNRKWLDTFD